MSVRDRERWNARYRERTKQVEAPAPYLLSADDVLPRQGRALDVAGGSGRNALWLAGRGLDVTVTDISDVALDQARCHARAAGVSLHTVVSDLELDPLPTGPWQVIVDFYFLLRPLFVQFARELAPGGYLVFAQPTMSNLQRHSQPSAKYLLENGELPRLISALDEPLEIIDYCEGWSREGRHEAHLLARRAAR